VRCVLCQLWRNLFAPKPCTGCGKQQERKPMSEAELLKAKRLVRVRLIFVTPEYDLLRVEWKDGDPVPTIPEDGFLNGKGLFADGTGENYGGDGWLVMGMTPKGLLCQTTGGDRPDEKRYAGFQFSRCRLAPSALMHVAAEEQPAWR
jgi:hypothetical protein